MDSNARRYYVQVTKKTPERWEDYKTARLSLSRAMPLRGSRSENFHFTRRQESHPPMLAGRQSLTFQVLNARVKALWRVGELQPGRQVADALTLGVAWLKPSSGGRESNLVERLFGCR
jgi:hypothetical protein